MNYIDQLIYNRIHKVKTYSALTRLVLIMTPPILATIFMLILKGSGEAESAALNWTAFILFVPSIYATLILIQRYELIGNYGESILLLIPTFVWLLPGNVEAIAVMLYSSLVLSILSIILFAVATLLPVISKKTIEEKTQSHTKISSILIRIAYASLAVVSTVVVSVVLIEWADFSMKWSQVKELGVWTTDYTSTGWVLFIGIVTLATAFALVALGLISAFESSKSGNINKTDNIQAKLDKFIAKNHDYSNPNKAKTQTITIKTIKRSSKRHNKLEKKAEKENKKFN